MRCLTPHESFWRIFELPLDEKSHSITRLDLHLPDYQNLFYKHGDDISEKIKDAEVTKTMLTDWFELNKRDSSAKQYYYHEIPEHYTYGKSSKSTKVEWHQKKGWKPCLGRMFSVSPKMGELFYLRTLLLHIKGCESWKDLLKYEDQIYKTFKEAVNARGLLNTIDDWVKYFEEAALVSLPHMLRELFVIVINHGENVDIAQLWELFEKSMCEDFVHGGLDAYKAENMAKAEIQKQLEVNGLSLASYGITLPNDFLIAEENKWDKTEQLELGNSMREKMTERQEKIVKHVFCKIYQLQKGALKNGCIYIDGPGESGKTYTYKTICHLFRANDIKYKTSSWMGIAANLLPDGRTMHKTFGLPFNVNKDASSHAKINNKVGRELIEAEVFIIDDISMVPKYAIEIIDRKLKELMQNDHPFGGKIMIIGGNESGLPPHELNLTKGCPVMLTRNLNPATALCNGTRLIVETIHKDILECKISTGEFAGKNVLIPKVTLTSSKFPFTLYRKQFPVKPCFAMTINKSQGQTIDFVGIDLTDPVFTHGMTYVAFSRARAWEFIKVAVKCDSKNKVKKVVWKEVLLDCETEKIG